MKRLIITSFIFLLASTSSFAQLVFQRIGGDTTYGSTGANFAYAYYTNAGTAPIEVRFLRTINVLPPDWSSCICVGACYAPEVNMIPLEDDPPLILAPGELDTIGINYFSPTLGISNVAIRMFVDNNPSQYVERRFDLNVNTVGINNISTIAESYSLSQNYPNPFNPGTIINFSIPKPETVSLKVYDILGNEVSTLLNNEKLNAGLYNVDFKVPSLSSGIYYYTIRTENFVDTKKMLLVK